MTSIDDRVVAMSFDNRRFEAGAAETLGTLGKLKEALSFRGGTKGLSDIDAAASRTNLGPLAASVDQVSQRLGAMRLVGIAAMGNLVAQAATAGLALAKSLTIDPVASGLKEYETNLNSIQTILANTQGQGTGLDDVNASLAELNRYADLTIYNFGEMARNIGTFTAAGVNLETATQSIKGIANLAALSGSNSQQASTAMYQLSQAIAAGKVNLQDWNSVVNAGMGGRVFQEALFNTAKAMGTIKDVPVGQSFKEWTAAGNSFRESLSSAQQGATDGAKNLAKAQVDASKQIANAEESYAETVENTAKQVKSAREASAETATRSAESIKSAGEQVKAAEQGVAETVKQTATAIKEAKARVKQAERDAVEVAKTSAEAVKQAQKDQAAALIRSAEDVQNALDDVTKARERLKEAMKPASADDLEAATDAVTTAQLDQKATTDAVEEAQRNQARAAQDLTKAETNLERARRTGDSDQIEAATRAVEDARQRVKDLADAEERAGIKQRSAIRGVTDAQEHLTETRDKGTAADKNVAEAQDGLTAAIKRVQEAQTAASESAIQNETRVKDARTAGAKARSDAAKTESDAEDRLKEVRKSAAKSNTEADKQLIESQKRLTEARQDGVKSQIEASERLTEAEQNQAKSVRKAQEAVAEAHENAAERIRSAQEAMNPPKDAGTWLTSDVLTSTLSQFTGDMSKAELAAQGFSDAQIKAIQAQASTASNAATQVKTLSAVLDTAREAAGSGWSETWKIIFGDFGEAKSSFTGVSQAVNGLIDTSSDARNKLLMDWKELGGRTVLIEGIKNAFDALGSVLKPIKDAFRDIFPPATGKTLYDLTVRFRDFTESLKVGPETAENLRRTFRGFFAVLDIGWQIVKGLFGVLGDLFGAAGEGSGGFLAFTGKIGDWLVALDKAIKKGGILTAFFGALGDILEFVVGLASALARAIGGLFGGFDSKASGDVSTSTAELGDALNPLKGILDGASGAWNGFLNILDKVKAKLQPAIDAVSNFVGGLGSVLGEAFKDTDFGDVFNVIQTVLLGGIFLLVKRFFSKGLSVDLGGGLLGGITESLEQLTGTLKAMQADIQAGTLLKIAGAIALLTAALVALSLIDSEALKKALTAMAVAFGQLLAAMAILVKISGSAGFIKLPLIAASMVLLAVAIDALVVAVYALSKLSWEELAKGLGGVAVLLGVISAAAVPLSRNSAGMISAGVGIAAIAVGMKILASAVKDFGEMSLVEIGKGLLAVAGALTVIALTINLFPPGMVATGTGLLAVAVALKVLASAVGSFGEMDILTTVTGLAGIAGAMIVIAQAMAIMPPGMAVQAAGLLLVAIALQGIGLAIRAIGSMDLETMVKGLVGLAAALGILAVGLTAMTGTLAGSAALFVASAALMMLAPALKLLATMSWEDIAKGMVVLAAAFGVMGVAAFLLAPLAPIMFGLSVAILALGAGVFLAGAGVGLLATGLSTLAVAGPAGVAVVIKALTDLVETVPTVVIKFVEGLVKIAGSLAEQAPKFVVSMGKIIAAIAEAVILAAPKIAEAFGALIQAALQVIVENFPAILAAGFSILRELLRGISDNIEEVTTRVFEIVTKFLGTVTEKLPELIAAGAEFLVSFLTGISQNAVKVITAAGNVIVSFLTGIAQNAPRVIRAFTELMIEVLAALGAHVVALVAAGSKMIADFLRGIGNSAGTVAKGATDMAGKFMEAAVKALLAMTAIGAQAVIDFINGLADTIRKYDKQLFDAGWNLTKAIGEGILEGLKSVPIVGKVVGLFGDAVGGVADLLGIHSPSRVFAEIGKNMMLGAVAGVDGNSRYVNAALQTASDTMVDTMIKTLSQIPEAVDGLVDLNPVVTPVLDLSRVREDAALLGGLTSVAPITADGTYQRALAMARERDASLQSQAEFDEEFAKVVMNFYQENNSPEALNEADIYRQTNNQLSKAKSELEKKL